MTSEQINLLLDAKIDLFHKAIRYSRLFTLPGVGDEELAEADRNFCRAAKNFAHVADDINPRLWEPPSTGIEPVKP